LLYLLLLRLECHSLRHLVLNLRLRRRLNGLLGGHSLQSLLLQVIRDERVQFALAYLFGFLPCLL
jgi:hypothetical protein